MTKNDLVLRDGLFYKKLSQVPFSGNITGQTQGTFKNGSRKGAWVEYWDNGQLSQKGNYKNGKMDGAFISYHKNGNVDIYWTGIWKNGKKISD